MRSLLALLVPGLMCLCIGHCTVHIHAAHAAQHHHSEPSQAEQHQLPLLDYHLLEGLTLSLLPPELGLLVLMAMLILLLLVLQRADQIRPRPLLPPPRNVAHCGRSTLRPCVPTPVIWNNNPNNSAAQAASS
ncbi:MAG: hypothetical protein AB4911_00610 [Oscillochloridaceae bacterium umkhey_bin13]